MKTITTLLIAATAAFSLNASAYDSSELHNDPGIGDVFPMQSVAIQEQAIRADIADTGKLVWSTSYEQWVNPADFNSTAKQTIASALQELENNPPAAGKRSNAVFIWDETADEFQLQ